MRLPDLTNGFRTKANIHKMGVFGKILMRGVRKNMYLQHRLLIHLLSQNISD